MNRTTADDYLSKPYARVLTPDSDGYYVAEILEFEGCVTEGRTPTAALKSLERVAHDWIETKLEEDGFIPEPFASAEMSGRFALRMPQSLHTKAAILAEREGISLNTFIVSALAMGVGALDLLNKWLDRADSHRPTTIQYNVLAVGMSEIKGTSELSLPPIPNAAFQEIRGTIG